MKNKAVLCKPLTMTKATYCKPHMQTKSCQTGNWGPGLALPGLHPSLGGQQAAEWL